MLQAVFFILLFLSLANILHASIVLNGRLASLPTPTPTFISNHTKECGHKS